MPSEKHPKAKSVESLRHAEYYDMQRTFDELYTRSQAREVFDNLMELILSKDNIMLAYRNIKSNSGSATPGTDRLRITDIGRLPADEVVARVRKIVRGGTNGYTPRSVRRKEIPKPNGKTRPLGIPCIWDRLIQQCIKQVMEPICEAKFSSNSYGFRPNRSVENAIAAIYRLMQRSGLYYVVEFDVKGFFDNVDHSKLIRQLWSMNIRDKELYIVRYADDFRILCRTKEQANRTLIAVTKWLTERLKLEVSPEKTRVVDVRRSYSEFLGFKIRLRKKGKKHVVQSHMCDKAYKRVKADLVKQVGNIKFPRACRGESGEVHLFNSMVMGIQNYYRLATDISLDCNNIGRAVDIVLKNRLKAGKSHRLKKEGRDLTKSEIQRYGKSKRLRYLAQSKEPVYPISYIRCKKPMDLKRNVCAYTPQGRSEIHNDLQMDTTLLLQLMKATAYSRSAEYMDNRISLFSAQQGKCAVTGKTFESVSDIHCHHKRPKSLGGTDCYGNLVLVLAPVHELIHATNKSAIDSRLSVLKLNRQQLAKLNRLRISAEVKPIDSEEIALELNSHNGMTKEIKKTV